MKILFYGDSIMFGQGVSTLDTWINQFAMRIEKGPNIANIIVENFSVSGRTTREALIDFPRFVQPSNAEILVIQFGLNDCNYWLTDNGVQRVNIDSFYYNLTEMADRALKNGVKQVIFNTNHPISKTIPINGDQIDLESANLQYNQKILKMGSYSSNVHVLDVHKMLLGSNKNTYLSKDGIHLSQNGNILYSEFFFNFIMEIL